MAIQIIDENRKPTTAEKFNMGMSSANRELKQYQMQQEARRQQAMAMQQEEKKRLHDFAKMDREYGLKEQLEGVKAREKFKSKIDYANKLGLLDNEEGNSGSQGTPQGTPSQEPAETKLTPDSLIDKWLLVDPNKAKILQQRNDQILKKQSDDKKANRSEFESDRTYHSKRSDPVIDKANAVFEKSPIRKGLINQQRRDIASGQTEGIIPFLVEKTGAEIYRNPESARFKTASKQRFIENLSSLGGGARPNMFIEQQLVGAQAALGRDAEANETILDMEEFIDDLELQRAKYVREIANQDREKYGYVKDTVAERADSKMEDYADKRQEQMAYDIRKRHEDRMSDDQLTQQIVMGDVTPDTPLTMRAARILMIKNNDDEKKAQAEAKRLGFRIPK